MGRTLLPVYIKIKKKTPVRYSRDSVGLSCITWYKSNATFSTNTGSNVRSN